MAERFFYTCTGSWARKPRCISSQKSSSVETFIGILKVSSCGDAFYTLLRTKRRL